ncbi:MAG: hypothetical protein GTN71_06375 [Anaerolineae bacterium]|nr:hypothetical protein [Anaerolineae bacterium]
MGQINYFVPGKTVEAERFLAHYVQPMPVGVATAYLEAYTSPGQIVLDPFCQSPTLVTEVVATGRKVIAANFNPALALLVRGQLGLPEPKELDAATTRLGDSLKLGVPLREHLDGLYTTSCPQCHRTTIADYFLWDREAGEPVQKGYRCQGCWSEGQAPVEPGERETLSRVERRGFHYHYVLDRLAPPGDEGRKVGQKLLDLYTPRNLYALANLLIKIETLFSDSPLQETLKLLLLVCLDSCSSLYASPQAWLRPRRLHPPPRFVERNVWRAFEEARVQLSQLPPSPAVHLATGVSQITSPDLLSLSETDGQPLNALVEPLTVRRLSQALPEDSVSLIITAPPRLDPVFWSLSYLWSGWLFGREEAAALRPLLKRKKTDWDWYQRAMSSTLRALRRALQARGRLVLVFATEGPAFVEALFMAANLAGFELGGASRQPGELPAGTMGYYQLSFAKGEEPTTALPSEDEANLAIELQRETSMAMQDVLRQRGEPLTYEWLHLAAYRHLSAKGYLRRAMAVSSLDFVPRQVETVLEGVDDGAIVRWEEIEEGEGWPQLWWLREPGEASPPLGDRVEEAVWEVLCEKPTLSPGALAAAIYPRFPGLLTPEAELIEACLKSYAQEIGPDHWQLRPEDQPENRERQLGQGVANLVKLGQRLGYGVGLSQAWRKRSWEGGTLMDLLRNEDPGVEPPSPFDVLWREDKEARHAFVLFSMAALGLIPWHKDDMGEGTNRYLVIPEERGDLASFKLDRSPWLRQAMVTGRWQFIKYRHLSQLVNATEVDRHDLKKIVGLRPIIEQDEAQIPLF